MTGRCIFTKTFFRLSGHDQSLVVQSILQELESTIGRHENPAHDQQVKQRVKRIRARAEKHGITV